MVSRIGFSSGSVRGTLITASARPSGSSALVTAMTGPPRALTSSTVPMFLATSSSPGMTATVGMSGSISASGPCLSACRLVIDSLGIRNLHMIDIPPVPDGFENSIVEAEDHDVLHRLFTQVMVDAIDLILLQNILDLAVQCLRRVEIVSKRLFDYHPAPMSILLPGELSSS